MSYKLFDVKVAPAKLRFACYFASRWEKNAKRWEWPSHHYHLDVGVNRYEGLKVRGTNVHPITFIVFFKVMPLFRVVLDITWRYKQELRLKINGDD